ncbi:hypothetical protein [Sphingomonas sp. BK235]|uniref:hypothetical protein n=1 Tax=Sphingomonas sp. BK235 TaxID=2512131 RepID=UPI00104E046A|nr:hypothetical protein [Sphingomonas sp. BK235]TCP37340.1 hypothetical protein EV292_101857 [Sphingomonas sp. BK235]
MAPLAATLDVVAEALRDARAPWWVIGSAAAWLHGAATTVDDVDVLLGGDDARAMIAGWTGRVTLGAAGERFRSSPIARLSGAALPIEVMTGLHVRVADGWRAVAPATRTPVGRVYVPERGELIAILTLFGRQKDRHRVELLRAGPG